MPALSKPLPKTSLALRRQRSPTREGYLGLVIPSTEHDQGNDSKTRPPPDYSLIDSAAYDPPDI